MMAKPVSAPAEDAGVGCGDDPGKNPAARRGCADREMPVPRKWFFDVFSLYSKWFIARHVHSVRVAAAGVPAIPAEQPLVIYLNHASWWDPLVCLLLHNRYFPERTAYAPIDAESLERYRFFRHLGFFGVPQNSRAGAASFVRVASRVVVEPKCALWLTPQGHFTDPRERPVQFRRGIGHLAARSRNVTFLPLAIEFPFWEEKQPEVLCHFGRPTVSGGEDRAPAEWTRHFEREMAHAQDTLADLSLRRDTTRLEPVLRGCGGVSLIYDGIRSAAARLRGEGFRREHGKL